MNRLGFARLKNQNFTQLFQVWMQANGVVKVRFQFLSVQVVVDIIPIGKITDNISDERNN